MGFFQSRPHRFNPRHDHRADHDAGEATVGAVKQAGEPFVAGKQAIDILCRDLVYREQVSGDIGGAGEPACCGHVDAVIVARAQIYRGEGAAFEQARCVLVAAEQLARGEMPSLGLENLAIFDAADLADRAVGGGKDILAGIGQRPGAGLQFAGEEVVEAAVFIDAARRFAHVDVVCVDEAADQQVLDRARLARGERARHAGDGVVRQHVLEPDEG